jgi:hypothetical protein
MALRENARRAFSYLIGLGVPCLVLSPLFSGAPDSFPLSTFPMFASARGTPVLYSMIGRSMGGAVQHLEPALIGSKEVLQTKVLIERSVAEGEAGMAALCSATAERAAASPAGRNLRSIEIVSRRYDPVGYFARGPQPLEEARLFQCKVKARHSLSEASR